MTLAPGWPTYAFLAVLIGQRLIELAIARRNTAFQLSRGGYEVGAGHYPVMVAMHAAWVLAIVACGWSQGVNLIWLAFYLMLQALRIWILATLGSRWTTRIIVSPGPLVTGGPFRWLRHPNYTLVVAEIVVAPMVLGLWWVAVIWTVLNAAMLRHRIAAEDAAIRPG